jgi:hypothetical protein
VAWFLRNTINGLARGAPNTFLIRVLARLC